MNNLIISESLEQFFGLKYFYKICGSESGNLFDPGSEMEKFGSGINIPDRSTPKFFQVDEVICEPLKFSRTPHIVQAQLCHLTRKRTASVNINIFAANSRIPNPKGNGNFFSLPDKNVHDFIRRVLEGNQVTQRQLLVKNRGEVEFFKKVEP